MTWNSIWCVLCLSVHWCLKTLSSIDTKRLQLSCIVELQLNCFQMSCFQVLCLAVALPAVQIDTFTLCTRMAARASLVLCEEQSSMITCARL